MQQQVCLLRRFTRKFLPLVILSKQNRAKLEHGAENRMTGKPLPPSPLPSSEERKKLLVFSDSRQDAAFFACYLGRTYSQFLRRRLIVRTLEQHLEALANRWRIQDVVGPVRRTAEELGVFPERWSPQQQTQ